MTEAHFGDRLSAAIDQLGPLCVGLDPYLDRIPSVFGHAERFPANTVEAFCSAVISRLAGRVAAVKPQIALFERLGPAGLTALARITERARDAGLLVILDAKRGDIAATAQGYVEAYLGPEAWLHADAVTVNPFMGLESVAPWLEMADQRGKGVVVLLRTSNAGRADLQDMTVAPEGVPVWRALADKLTPLSEARCGASGWSSLMAVVGATAPEEAKTLRGALPHTPFLVPGYGAQGASAQDALAGAVPGPDGRPSGVLINASRSVLYPDGAQEAADLASWGEVFGATLRQTVQLTANTVLS